MFFCNQKFLNIFIEKTKYFFVIDVLSKVYKNERIFFNLLYKIWQHFYVINFHSNDYKNENAYQRIFKSKPNKFL